ncbi:GGDEF domain-containing protein [Deinococcus altitudinis]|uniref:GGDEF domain-containing protein n=1 Tax=Deinococcus altitudinis TaxID=468914 RepID=UPI0038914794
MIPLLLWRKLPLQQVVIGALTAASLVVMVELYRAFQAGGVGIHLYFAGIFLILTAFSILPIWQACLYSAVLYLILVTLTLLSHGDVTYLAELALTVLLIAHLSVFGERVSAERAEARTFQLLASTDFLTALANRRAMYPQLEAAFSSDAEHRQTAILLLDIDHFKQVNDRHGHLVGDEVLQQFALVLQQGVGNQDVVSRWGGEEFLILLPNCSKREAIDRADYLLQQIRLAAMPAGLQITASCGMAHAAEVESAEAWLLCADRRLYSAKESGRDQVSSLDHCAGEAA